MAHDSEKPTLLAPRNIVFFVLVTLALFFLIKTPPPVAGVSFVFLGFTNSYCPELSERCVSIGITNGSSLPQGFAVDAVEWDTGQGWKEVSYSSLGWNFGGKNWAPGYGHAVAVLVPREVPASTAWRVRYLYWEEPKGLKDQINQYFDQNLSKYAVHLRGSTSSIVVSNMPALMPNKTNDGASRRPAEK